MIPSRICFITAVLMLSAGNLCAQAEKKLTIDNATVFLSGAELESSTDINLAKGENEILFTNVAGDVNEKSITVAATNGIVVESVVFQNDYLAPATISPQAKEIKDSIELVTDNKEQINNKLSVIEEQIAVLQENKKVGGQNTGLSVAELTKMLDLAGQKWTSYLDQKTTLKRLLAKTDERLTKLKNQLDEIQKNTNQPEGVLRIKFYAKESTNTSITIGYIIANAGWTPTYDIFADNVNSPVKLFYKANIHQSSGINWDNVHLSLSTGNPNEGMQPPVLNPWYLAFYIPPVYNNAPVARGAGMEVYEYKKPLINYDRTEKTLTSSINDYVAIDNSGVNTTFDIDLPYTIPSDGEQHLVAIKRYELPASYSYFAIPKTDKDAFLEAHITGWEDLNLLPGQTNIFYEGAYVGQGNIDVRNLKDTMDISLGRDKKIVIKREQDKKMRSVKTIGSNVRETFAYTISVRNTRKENVNLTIQDQMPVSNDKDIEIEDKETAGSDYNDTTGTMKWSLTIQPNQTQNISFGYTVKYPKGKTVVGLK